MRRVVSRHDQRGRFDAHNLLGLRAGRSIAVEERAAARLHDPQIALLVLRLKGRGEPVIAGDARRPWTGFRILPEAFLFPGTLGHSRQSLIPYKSAVAGQPPAAAGFPPT